MNTVRFEAYMAEFDTILSTQTNTEVLAAMLLDLKHAEIAQALAVSIVKAALQKSITFQTHHCDRLILEVLRQGLGTNVGVANDHHDRYATLVGKSYIKNVKAFLKNLLKYMYRVVESINAEDAEANSQELMLAFDVADIFVNACQRHILLKESSSPSMPQPPRSSSPSMPPPSQSSSPPTPTPPCTDGILHLSKGTFVS
jgi:hypothetical protein